MMENESTSLMGQVYHSFHAWDEEPANQIGRNQQALL
jgi:hypothetical protein